MKQLRIVIIGLCLLIGSYIYVAFNAQTIDFKCHFMNEYSSPDEFDINIETEGIIEVTDIKVDGKIATVTFKSIKPGKTYVSIETSKEESKFDSFHVHPFGILTSNSYFGYMKAVRIIPLAIALYVFIILYELIRTFRQNLRDNMYRYENVLLLGLIIFLTFMAFYNVVQCFTIDSLYRLLGQFVSLTKIFSAIMLPITFVVSIFVMMSQINLMRNEGISWRNMLGLFLGGLLCIATITPFILGEWLQRTTIVDVHNMAGMAMYVEISVEMAISIFVTYLECLLLGTIIMCYRAAKHIPSFNQDYILILGSMIRSDGSLTPLLQGRTDRAIEFASMQKEATGKDITFVPSGGQGSDEVMAEGQAIHNYLVSTGINEDDILVEDRSLNTEQNIRYSYELIKQDTDNQDVKIALSTTNYHVFRAGCLATAQGIKVEGIGSPTKRYFWINAFIREFIATIVSERKRHILFAIILMAIDTLVVYMLYLAYNL